MPTVDPISIVLQGDCRNLLPEVKNLGFDFAFADPPFNIGHPYPEYQDKLPGSEYEAFTEDWLSKLCETGASVIGLHGPDDLVESYLKIPRDFGYRRIAWVNWHYRFGVCQRSNWIDARCHCLIYARGEYTWNPDEVLVESDRASKYGDKRVDETERGGLRLPGTVWGVPSDGPYWGRVQGNSEERVPDSPNQLPEVYLERLVRAYTNPGDRILDVFSGTGTLAVVAAALKRMCVSIELGRDTCLRIRQRLERGSVRVRKGV